eukprot:6214648-Pleurochrysis_carterae.AAC.2
MAGVAHAHEHVLALAHWRDLTPVLEVAQLQQGTHEHKAQVRLRQHQHADRGRKSPWGSVLYSTRQLGGAYHANGNLLRWLKREQEMEERRNKKDVACWEVEPVLLHFDHDATCHDDKVNTSRQPEHICNKFFRGKSVQICLLRTSSMAEGCVRRCAPFDGVFAQCVRAAEPVETARRTAEQEFRRWRRRGYRGNLARVSHTSAMIFIDYNMLQNFAK